MIGPSNAEEMMHGGRDGVGVIAQFGNLGGLKIAMIPEWYAESEISGACLVETGAIVFSRPQDGTVPVLHGTVFERRENTGTVVYAMPCLRLPPLQKKKNLKPNGPSRVPDRPFRSSDSANKRGE